MKTIMDAMDEAKLALAEFQSGPLAAFGELEVLTPPPPEPEEEVRAEEAAVDSASAAAPEAASEIAQDGADPAGDAAMLLVA